MSTKKVKINQKKGCLKNKGIKGKVDNMGKVVKKKIRSYSSSTAHQRIDDHEKLCRIMQEQTNRKIERLEKIVMSSTAMLIIGMATIIYNLIIKI